MNITTQTFNSPKEAGVPKAMKLMPFRIWRTNDEWRVRAYNYASHVFMEAKCKSFAWSLYTVGFGLGWWKDIR